MDVDVVIVGAGLAGSGAAWTLAREGRSVLVLEQFSPGHANGSSHGSARIVRRAYGDLLYARLTGRAFELWRELEIVSGEQLLRMLGGLDFGQARGVDVVAGNLAAVGAAHELLPAHEAERRWPGMRFEGDVVFHEQAGTVDAATAVAAMLRAAAEHGAHVRHDSPVRSVDLSGAVTLDSGEVVRAGTVVVAAGSWLPDLAGGLVTLPPVQVTEQDVFHFPRRDPSAPAWPSVIHDGPRGAIYHLAGGRDGGQDDDRKIGDHHGVRPCTPTTRRGTIDENALAVLTAYVERWLPGLVAEPSSSTTCLYTNTASEDFVLDRVDSLVICSPCSGHAAKFAPLVGEWVAAAVRGEDDVVPDRFRLAAHAAGRRHAVSL